MVKYSEAMIEPQTIKLQLSRLKEKMSKVNIVS